MAELPERPPIPIRFEDHPALVGLAAEPTVARRFAVVQKGSPRRQAAVMGRVGHFPGVDYVALEVDEVDHTPRRREQGEARESSLRVKRTEAGSSTPDPVLFDSALHR